MNRRWLTLVVAFALSILVLAIVIWITFDHVVLANQHGAGVANMLVDGWNGSCHDDLIRKGAPVRLWNFKPSATCLSEVAVFARENAVNLVTPVETWTDGADDLTITQAGLLAVPLTVWILSGLPNDATVHATRADQVYNEMQAGIRFTLDIRDRRTTSTIASAGCEDLTALTTDFPPIAGRLNVYYVPDVTVTETIGANTYTYSVNGRWCEGNPNVVLIGLFSPETLAHELGHAFTLAHVLTPSTNVMYGLSVPRDSLTTGQAFRINVNADSALNTNGVRTGPTRSCPDTTSDARCPALALDILPK